jgi:hypothetical protein
MAAETSRVSAEMSESPFSRDSWLSAMRSAATSSFPCSNRCSSRPGSTAPERLPMTTPSSGAVLLVVATECPPLTVASDQPLPRWQMTIFVCASGRLRSAAACSAQ